VLHPWAPGAGAFLAPKGTRTITKRERERERERKRERERDRERGEKQGRRALVDELNKALHDNVPHQD